VWRLEAGNYLVTARAGSSGGDATATFRLQVSDSGLERGPEPAADSG
jgi:hypothetical protein